MDGLPGQWGSLPSSSFRWPFVYPRDGWEEGGKGGLSPDPSHLKESLPGLGPRITKSFQAPEFFPNLISPS